MSKRQFTCRTCGSDQVVRDAWASWSYEQQEWELGEMFDYAFCIACESECTIHAAEEEAQPASPTHPSSPLPTETTEL